MKQIACLLWVCLAVSTAGFSQRSEIENRITQNFPPAPPLTHQDDRVLTNTDLISFTVTVTDRRGQHISGLDRSALTVLDDGMPQEFMIAMRN